MAYTPTTWSNNLTITPTLMNKLLQAVEACSTITGGSGSSSSDFDAIIDVYVEDANPSYNYFSECTITKGSFNDIKSVITSGKTPKILVSLYEDQNGYIRSSSSEISISDITYTSNQPSSITFKVKIWHASQEESVILTFTWNSSNEISMHDNFIYLTDNNIVIITENTVSGTTRLSQKFANIYNNLATGKTVFIKTGNTTLSSCMCTIGLMPIIGAAYDGSGAYRIYAQDIKSISKSITESGSVYTYIGVPTVRTYTTSGTGGYPEFSMTLSPAPVATQPSTSKSMLTTLT